MEPLRIFPAWVRRTIPTGISNDVMASGPQHPFFLGVIEQLERYNRNWGLPYITVMYSTGPLFLSVLWTEYLSRETPVEHRVRVMKPDMFDKCDWSFFTQHKGSSWHSGDAKLIFWVRFVPTLAGQTIRHAKAVVTDGPTLDATYDNRLRRRRSRQSLCMVDIRPHLPAWRLSKSRPTSFRALLLATHQL